MVPCLHRQPVGRQVAQGGHTDGHAPTTGRVGAFYICNVSDQFISRFQKVQLWRRITKCSSGEGGKDKEKTGPECTARCDNFEFLKRQETGTKIRVSRRPILSVQH